jgi:two-component system, chemotaxis family, protein-glutamate methylesterase/glutaminase
MGRHIRVLVVDDSLVAREMLSQILASDSEIEVVGEARDGEAAVRMVAELKPDLITMDIHMPKMDGLEATEQIMAFHPTPILVVSSSVHGEGMGRAFGALSAGALEVVKKPEPSEWADLDRIARDMIRKVKVLSNVRVVTHVRGRRPGRAPAAEGADPGLPTDGFRIIAIGSSTGGPSALAKVLGRLPAGLPVPVVVTQHMADGFVPGLVTWLDGITSLDVVVAEHGAAIEPGVIYVAPTGVNLEVGGARLRLTHPAAGQIYVPCADNLFSSVARSYGRHAVGVILTGMGADGAGGLRALRDAGGVTIAQDEKTSVVFGMPKAAIDGGAVRHVQPVEQIGETLATLCGKPARI